MRTHSRLFRLTATTAIVGMALGPLLSEIAVAQSAPPPLAPPAPAPASTDQTTVDPPARVGALSRIVGQVSFHGTGATEWSDATLNFPVTSGDSFWTQPSASADILVTNNRVTMDQQTELDVTTLDNQNFVAQIPQGQVYLRLLALAAGETYTVVTPRGSVAITAPGQYEIAAGDTQDPTRITVVQGAAQVSGSSVNVQVAANQTLLITGTDPFQTQVVPAQRDAFLTAQLARDQPPVAQGGVTAPAVVAQMTGGDDLYQYGTYTQVPQYGTVWYPQVASGYVPYRNGHWAYVAPWGWTWVDAAPWGFAPFHYGRWVDIDGRWGWVPGGGAVAYGQPGYVAPVYAPALVTFFGIGLAVGAAVGIAAAGGFHGNVGWCPLGWQEPYRPWYHASPAYVRNVNVVNVRNVTNITRIENNNVTINNFANRAGATMVPASAMVASRPINQVARPIPPAQYAQARPVLGREPVPPTRETAGVTPRVAQNLHLAAPPPGAAPARPAAPGPAIRAEATPPNARPALAAPGHPGAPGAERPTAGPPPAGAPPAERPAAAVPGRPGAPNAPAAAEHAPGPPIEPHGAASAPALRTPAEAAHPQERAAGAPAAPAAARPAEAPHVAAPITHPQVAAPATHPQVAAPAAHPQVAAPAAHPQVAAPAAHPQVAEPQARPPAHEAPPRVTQESRPPAERAPAPHPAPPPHAAPVRAAPAPAPERAAPRPAPEHAAAPRPAPHPEERKNEHG